MRARLCEDATTRHVMNEIAQTTAAPAGLARWCLPALLVCATALHAGAAETTPAHTRPRTATHASEIDWQTSPLDLDLRGMNGERYVFRCPPGKPLPSRVVGSGPYTDDSSICSAAVHAGAIRAKDGGDVTIEIRPGEARYAASERNYIRSAAYDRAWSGSFVVLTESAAPKP
jgi:hypothetical protein